VWDGSKMSVDACVQMDQKSVWDESEMSVGLIKDECGMYWDVPF